MKYNNLLKLVNEVIDIVVVEKIKADIREECANALLYENNDEKNQSYILGLKKANQIIDYVLEDIRIDKILQEATAQVVDWNVKDIVRELEKNNIPYKVCNLKNGQINLLRDGKTLIEYYAGARTCYIPILNYKEKIDIKECIKRYNEV